MEKGKKLEQTIDSRDVAEMVGKEHKELLRDVRRYVEQLAESKIALGDFFTESTYIDANNQSRPCYNITKKGCEFIANKLTGVKGTEFTAKYINRFHEMQEIIATEQTRQELAEMQKEMQTQRKMLQEVMKNQQYTKWRRSGYCDPTADAYIDAIVKIVTGSWDVNYLEAVFTFAITYPGGNVPRMYQA